MKRSATITLVLLSTITLSACSSEPDEARMQYRSLQDCIDDWGDVNLCERDPAMNSSAGALFFVGPYFLYQAGKYMYKTSKKGSFVPLPAGSQLGKPGYSSRSTGTVMRGGFGRSFSSSS